MELHEIENVYTNNKTHSAGFRKMSVENGYLYNFWNNEKDDWGSDWIHVAIVNVNINRKPKGNETVNLIIELSKALSRLVEETEDYEPEKTLDSINLELAREMSRKAINKAQN